MIQKASARIQVILATQSVPLLNQFQPEDVVVVDRRDGASEFQRLSADSLAAWLEDYTRGVPAVAAGAA